MRGLLDAPLQPTIHAGLNALSGIFLLLGWRMIRSGRRDAHKAFMLAAVACSALFLASYLHYHFRVGSVGFQGTGFIRSIYFAILLSHTILAAVLLPMILRTLWLAKNERFENHARLARWTFPVWLYVSVTGVVVYSMLYLMKA